jgi:hypothetical protein
VAAPLCRRGPATGPITARETRAPPPAGLSRSLPSSTNVPSSSNPVTSDSRVLLLACHRFSPLGCPLGWARASVERPHPSGGSQSRVPARVTTDESQRADAGEPTTPTIAVALSPSLSLGALWQPSATNLRCCQILAFPCPAGGVAANSSYRALSLWVSPARARTASRRRTRRWRRSRLRRDRGGAALPAPQGVPPPAVRDSARVVPCSR